MTTVVDINTFGELQSTLSALPNQSNGLPQAFSQTGEEYREFFVKIPYRPGDKIIAEQVATQTMWALLSSYFSSAEGGSSIYWRIPLEEEDMEWVDRDWRIYKQYCRTLCTTKKPATGG